MKTGDFRRSGWGYVFLAPYVVLFVMFLVLPLVFGLGLSAFRWEMLSITPPQFLGLGNYLEAVQDEYFWKALRATFFFVVMAVPVTVILSLSIALAINAIPSGRQGLYRAVYFLPTMLSISVVGILWRWFYNSEFGLFNAYLAPFGAKVPWITDPQIAMPSIVLMTLWWTVGGPMVIFLAGLSQIPKHYYEAAAIDGASTFDQFRHVTLPLLRRVLLFVMVMNVIGAFQVFGQTFLITRGGPEFATRVLVQYIYETAFGHYRMGYGAAMSWLLFIAILIFSLLQFRIMREDDTAGTGDVS